MDAGRRKPIFGLRPVTALTMVRPAAAPVTARNGDGGGDAETRLSIAWLANPSNLEWRNAPDADPGRRAFVVNRMLEILEGPGKTIEQDPQSDADSEGTPACP